MAKKLVKKVVKAVKQEENKVKKVTAASIVLGMFNLKVVPSDDRIIAAVQEACEGSKFDKTHLSWYKHQYRIGRWNDGETMVIRQEDTKPVENVAKTVAKKVAKKASKKVVQVEEEEEVEA